MISPEEFKKDVMVLAEEIGVQPKEITLCQLGNKWGKCTSEGFITFDIMILKEPQLMRKKIVLHELLHLKYPNHGKMFNTLLHTYLENRKDESLD
jgi:hypothetical protein